MDIEGVATQIVDAAIKVHRALGPGLLESVYGKCLAYELDKRGLCVETEVVLPVIYYGVHLNTGYRIDMVIERCVIIENKTVDQLLPIHQSQMITYLKLGNFQLGFLLNWNVTVMKNGIRRFVNQLPEDPRYKNRGENN